MGDAQADRHPQSERDRFLEFLMADVRRTRALVRDRLDKDRANRSQAVLDARNESRAALEALVDALEQRALPVPRQIHAELQLVRGLCRHSWSPGVSAPRTTR